MTVGWLATVSRRHLCWPHSSFVLFPPFLSNPRPTICTYGVVVNLLVCTVALGLSAELVVLDEFGRLLGAPRADGDDRVLDRVFIARRWVDKEVGRERLGDAWREHQEDESVGLYRFDTRDR